MSRSRRNESVMLAQKEFIVKQTWLHIAIGLILTGLTLASLVFLLFLDVYEVGPVEIVGWNLRSYLIVQAIASSVALVLLFYKIWIESVTAKMTIKNFD